MIKAYASGRKNSDELINAKVQLKSLMPDELLIDHYSPGHKNSKFKEFLTGLRNGDRLLLYSVATTGKTAKQLIAFVSLLTQRGVTIELIEEKLIIDADSSISKFCRALNKGDRHLKSIASKLQKSGGRPEGTYNKENARTAAELYLQNRPISEILEKAGIKSKRTLYKHLEREGIKLRNKH